MKYQDLQLVVTQPVPLEENAVRWMTFQVQVTLNPLGGTVLNPVAARLNLNPVRAFRQKLAQNTLAPEELLVFGRLLGEALFPVGEIRQSLVNSLTSVRARTGQGPREGLRLHLNLPPELSHIPWECLLINLKGGPDTQTDLLALQPDISIVRFRAALMPQFSIEANLPVRVLAALAGPASLPPLDLDTENAVLQTTFGGSPDFLADIRRAAAHTVVGEGQPAHIFHFAGHGSFLTTQTDIPGIFSGSSQLIFEENGQADPLPAGQAAVSLRSRGVRVALLNACQTGQTDPVNIWSSAAAELLTGGLGAVIGMQFKVGDREATAFCRAFYQTLVKGAPVDQAVTQGRLAAYAVDPGRDWITPVLYLNTPSGLVFEEWASSSDMRQMAQWELDFSGYIAKSTLDFTARGWLFAQLDAWLAQPDGPRYFQLQGLPGSGKTAIAARLVQFSLGQVAAPQPQLGAGFLSAWHFCAPEDSRWPQPLPFAQSIAWQLAGRYWRFREALLNVLKRANLTWDFNSLVLEPLNALFKAGHTQPVVILIDSLDEAAAGPGGSIADLVGHVAGLPEQVRFIITRWPQPAPPNTQVLDLNDPTWLACALADVHEYALEMARRLAAAGRLAPGYTVEELAAAARDRSQSNELYAHALFQSLNQSSTPITAADLEEWPAGLDALYSKLLDKVSNGGAAWPQLAPVVAALAVAQTSLTEVQLAHFVNQTPLQVRAVLAALRPVLRSDDSLPPSRRPWAIYHHSFADYILNPERAGLLNVEEAGAHLAIAEYYLEACSGDWTACDEDECGANPAGCTHYGLRHTAYHLARAAELQTEWKARHALALRLVNLVTDDNFIHSHLACLDEDWNTLRDTLGLALARAAADRPPVALPLVVRAALGILDFESQHLNPRAVFTQAAAGAVQAAERRLALFCSEPLWHQGALAAAAWLALPTDPHSPANQALYQQLLALRNRVAPTLDDDLVFRRLLARLDAALGLAEPPPLPPLLERVPPPEEGQKIVADLGMQEDQEGLFMTEGMPDLSGLPNDKRILLQAELDAPRLVSLAHANPALGNPLLDEYMRVQSSNSYVEYRNEVFVYILEAVLAHPDPEWVRRRLPVIMAGVLQVDTVQFRGGLPLVVTALQAASGDAGALQKLNSWWQTLEQNARALRDERGRSDTVGHFRRKLGALAECLAVLPLQIDPASGFLALPGGAAADKPQRIAQLLRFAYSLPRGYAGYLSPARLTLAETTRICGLDQQPYPDTPERTWLRVTLDDALASAHNIQDVTFCLGSTARVNAMRLLWWQPGGFDVAAQVAGLARSPQAPEYTARHILHETYRMRSHDRSKILIPAAVRTAETLEELAEAYHKPLADFRRLNEGIPPELVMHEDGHERRLVRVPDNNFCAYLAARVAAEVLVSPVVTDARQRVQLLQRLVPVALRKPTALDSVLQRLLLAAFPLLTPDVLGELAKATPPLQP